MRKRILPILFCAASANASAHAADPEKSATDDPQTLVLFGDARPVLIHLHVRVDDQTLGAAWEEVTRSIFESLDANKDGGLDAAELDRMLPPQVYFDGSFNIVGSQPPPSAGDGKVTLERFRTHCRQNGGSPFRLSAAPTTRRIGINPSAATLNETLFTLLDGDKDGKLSAQELARVPAILLQKDADDDEIIEPLELAPPNYSEILGRERLEPGKNREKVPFLRVLNPSDSPAALARELLTQYGVQGQAPARKLTAKEIGLDEATFGQLDMDGNGILDNEELMRFAKRPPDIEAIVRLGKRVGGKPRLELAPGENRPLNAKIRSPKDGTLELDFGGSRFELHLEPEGGQADRKILTERYGTLFRKADRDNNGYLESNEARQTCFSTMFKAMDVDGDGKVSEKEMIEYVEILAGRQIRAAATVFTLNVAGERHGLFDLIDTNRDGRLSLREMRDAVKLIRLLDRDGDGKISRGEIPRTQLALLTRGKVANLMEPVGINALGPLWLQKMDLNRDGDVSRREFLGTREQFQKIDTDGDSLISVEEANAFELKQGR
jgi:Ca2+-binding EF-hand superfamily protein